MLNYVAIQMTSFLVTGPDERPESVDRERPDAQDPAVGALAAAAARPAYRVHWGFMHRDPGGARRVVAAEQSTLGFEIRTVGANPQAARYAGIAVGRTIVLTMALSGGLAGLAGASKCSG